MAHVARGALADPAGRSWSSRRGRRTHGSAPSSPRGPARATSSTRGRRPPRPSSASSRRAERAVQDRVRHRRLPGLRQLRHERARPVRPRRRRHRRRAQGGGRRRRVRARRPGRRSCPVTAAEACRRGDPGQGRRRRRLGRRGVAVARGLRAEGYDREIVLLGAENDWPYDKPPLSKQIITGEWDAGRASLLTPEQAQELDLDVRLGRRAEALDVAAKEIVLAGGDRVSYGACVIATGAAARPSPWPERPGVHVLRTLEDALAIRERLLAGGHIAIVGGGFIGAEVASSARTLGLEATVIDPLELPMERIVGPDAARLFAGPRDPARHRAAARARRGGDRRRGGRPDADAHRRDHGAGGDRRRRHRRRSQRRLARLVGSARRQRPRLRRALPGGGRRGRLRRRRRRALAPPRASVPTSASSTGRTPSTRRGASPTTSPTPTTRGHTRRARTSGPTSTAGSSRSPATPRRARPRDHRRPGRRPAARARSSTAGSRRRPRGSRPTVNWPRALADVPPATSPTVSTPRRRSRRSRPVPNLAAGNLRSWCPRRRSASSSAPSASLSCWRRSTRPSSRPRCRRSSATSAASSICLGGDRLHSRRHRHDPALRQARRPLWVEDRAAGRRIAIFLVGSLLCGLAQNMTELIAFRAVPGPGGGGRSRSRRRSSATRSRRATAAATRGSSRASSASPRSIGPLAGPAPIVEHVSWRCIFLVNIPLGLVAFVVIGVVFHSRRQSGGGRLIELRRRRGDDGLCSAGIVLFTQPRRHGVGLGLDTEPRPIVCGVLLGVVFVYGRGVHPDPAAAPVPQPRVQRDERRLVRRRCDHVRRADVPASVPADRQGHEPDARGSAPDADDGRDDLRRDHEPGGSRAGPAATRRSSSPASP